MSNSITRRYATLGLLACVSACVDSSERDVTAGSGGTAPEVAAPRAPSTASGVLSSPAASLTVDRSGGRLEVNTGQYAGFALEVPPEAVSGPTVITATASRDLSPQSARAFIPVGPAVTLEPHGIRFQKPVTVTLPLDFAQGGDPEKPIVVLRQEGGRRSLLFSSTSVQAGRRQVAVQVDGFSVFQPIQFPLDELIAAILDQATCLRMEALAPIAWNTHLYYYCGAAANVTVGLVQGIGGVDAVFDFNHLQLGTFWYLGLGLYSDLGSAGASLYGGLAVGVRGSVQHAWSGNMATAQLDVDLGTFATGFLGLGAGLSGFVSCKDRSIPPNQICEQGEMQAPWEGDAVFGGAAYLSGGISFFPEAVVGLVNGGASVGYWSSLVAFNTELSKYFDRWKIAHQKVEVATPLGAASYLSFGLPGDTEFVRSLEMAKAAAVLGVTPVLAMAPIAVMIALSKDGGCDGSGECLKKFCAAGGAGTDCDQPDLASCDAAGCAWYACAETCRERSADLCQVCPRAAGCAGTGGTSGNPPSSAGGLPTAVTGGTSTQGTGGVGSQGSGGRTATGAGGTPASTSGSGGAQSPASGGRTATGAGGTLVDPGCGTTGDHGDPCTAPAETWRCVYSPAQGTYVSQVCRAGIWQTYHLNPSDCGNCCGQFSTGCQQSASEPPLATGAGGSSGGSCPYGDTGNHADPCTVAAETWRCVYSSVQGANVSQVCRSEIWQTYHRNPSDCSTCCGDYTVGCAQ